MDPVFEIYEGNEPYVFISYSHDDSSRVVPLIKGLQAAGFRVWYDAGISPGSEFAGKIANRIKASGCMISFLSNTYIKSNFCLREINYALQLSLPLIPVYLESVTLEPGLEMQLSPIHAMNHSCSADDNALLRDLFEIKALQPCRTHSTPDPNVGPTPGPNGGTIIAPQKHDPKLNRWILIVVAAVVAIVLLLTILTRCGKGPDSGDSTESTPPKNTSAATTEATSPTEDTTVATTEATTAPTEAPVVLPTGRLLTAEEYADLDRSLIRSILFVDSKDVDRPVVIQEVKDWPTGTFCWGYEENGLYEMVVAAPGGVVAPNSCKELFLGFKNLEEITFRDFDTSRVTTMHNMFGDCHFLKELDLSGFDVANVKDMAFMFNACYALESVTFGDWDTSKLNTIGAMFQRCMSLTKLDMNCFETDLVTDMGYVFYGCENLKELMIENWDTTSANRMSCMFAACSSLTELDLSHFKTGGVESMYSMFSGCSKLEKLNLRGWSNDKVTDMTAMFQNCTLLEELILEGFGTASVQTMKNMFCGHTKLTKPDITGFDTTNVKDMTGMFIYNSAIVSLDLSHFKSDNLQTVAAMFFGSPNLTQLVLGDWNISGIEHNLFMSENQIVNGKPWEELFN